jgi:hypothetical protein
LTSVGLQNWRMGNFQGAAGIAPNHAISWIICFALRSEVGRTGAELDLHFQDHLRRTLMRINVPAHEGIKFRRVEPSVENHGSKEPSPELGIA